MRFVKRRGTKEEFDLQCREALAELEALQRIIRQLRQVNRSKGPEEARRVLRATAILHGVET